MSDEFDIDPQLLREFLSESAESLEGLDRLFIQLEEKPDDKGVIDQIFRPVHSIKGNSSFFGLLNVKNFSHAMENILQDVRAQKRKATKPIIDVLLRGSDLLRTMVERSADSDASTEFTAEEDACMKEFHDVLSEEGEDIASVAGKARQAMNDLASLDVDAHAQSAIKSAHELVMQVLNQVAPVQSASSNSTSKDLLYFIAETDVSAEVRTVASFVKHIQSACEDDDNVAEFLQALNKLSDLTVQAQRAPLTDALSHMHSDFTTIHSSGIGFDELMASLLEERLESFMSGVEVKEASTPQAAPPAPEEAAVDAAVEAATKEDAAEKPAPEAKKEEPKAAAATQGKTLRVDEEKVDSFMSFVGELIISSEVFAYLQKKLEAFHEVRDIAQEFKNANLAFNELSYSLQKSLMSVRRMPLRSVLQKMPRIVRDITTANGKDVQLLMEGEDTQIDKSLLEGLENPLVHMVRNSVDHGIEMPADREAAGKPARGTVWLTAIADEEVFRLIIKDDGKGLDLEAIKDKAVSKGTISEDRARSMTDQEAARLIFGAGVSTAKQVTDISGRGVGMDVVISNIEKLNGNVEIETELGKGTTFTISLPMTVTLMVVDGLVARVGDVNYIIPLMDVRESVRPRADQIFTVTNQGEVVDVRGDLCRLLRLYETLEQPGGITVPADATVIIVENRGQICGLMVDEVLGQQSVVLKDLGKDFAELDIIQGGAILGDGRVGLVLNTEGLIRSLTS